MKQSKDPFEAAFEDSPPESPVEAEADGSSFLDTENPASSDAGAHPQSQPLHHDTTKKGAPQQFTTPPPGTRSGIGAMTASGAASGSGTKNNNKEEEEENMDVELGKFPSSGDPDKMAKMQAILSQFTEEQMSRYESFRRGWISES